MVFWYCYGTGDCVAFASRCHLPTNATCLRWCWMLINPSGTLDSPFSVVLYDSAYVKILLHLPAAAILAILFVCLPAATPPSDFSSCFQQSPDSGWQVQVHFSDWYAIRITHSLSSILRGMQFGSRYVNATWQHKHGICCVFVLCVMSFMRSLPWQKRADDWLECYLVW